MEAKKIKGKKNPHYKNEEISIKTFIFIKTSYDSIERKLRYTGTIY